MGSNIALTYLKKIPKKGLGLGFDNLVKPEYLNMRSVKMAVSRMVLSTLSSITKSTMMNF